MKKLSKPSQNKTWNKALIDCVGKKSNSLQGKPIRSNKVEKLVQSATIPSWNSNVHSYRF
ncbi:MULTISPECIES: dynobactin A family peptide antibiotic [Photorhabdus]|uniref:Uncharacterized protein n=1 Tax=Photorhabdus australis subsp. thailandensis TaxID=2805096 RepID=A0A1C0U7H2_9GAMM|nr:MULTISPECIES: dynobactin A family peptide antibiotic [Photorhabdus]MCW7762330.1 hypothetical protein [Photorhabdus luminescens subsp. venezuelensis]OCQ53859.1 hypothetical protein Ppb6_00877 [Photorhabdus australis subsp. thailandensis]